MHVVHLNYTFDQDLEHAEEAIDRYATLREWAEAVRAAGATQVTVVQRFRRGAQLTRNGVSYLLCADSRRWARPGWRVFATVNRRVARLGADVVHVHGLEAPMALWHLRRALPGRVALLAQDHASPTPSPGRRSLRAAASFPFRRAGYRAIDGVLFTAEEQAQPWKAAGVLDQTMPVFAVLEASTTLHERVRLGASEGSSGGRVPLPADRAEAARAPRVLWVGRLNENKDPLTALKGFQGLLTHKPAASLTVVCGSHELRPDVERRIASSPELRRSVTLVDRVPPDDLVRHYETSDVFLSASHREGSGFSLIESLAFGVSPAVTAIPSFRAITGAGAVGAMWAPGDPEDCARALLAASTEHALDRRRVRAHFDAHLSWRAVGARALVVYEAVARRRAGGAA